MGRPRRAADGGLVYHVLNRANARMTIFDKPEDYDAFERVLEEAVDRTETRLLAYCAMPNHWHLVVWQRSCVSRPVQIIRRSRRRAFPHGLPLRGAECPASRSRPTCGGVALGQSLSMEAWQGEGKVAVGFLAATASGRLGGAGQHTADGGRVVIATTLGQPRLPIRRDILVRSDGASPRTSEYPSPSRTTKET